MSCSEEEIYRKYAEELIRFAAAVVGPDDAADAMSAGFLRAVHSPGWDEVAQPRAYLYRAVLNEARMLLRREATRRRYEARAGERERIDEVATRAEAELGVRSFCSCVRGRGWH
jgi:DNA-directed RNA polymerase specialized sigma24 family protein